MLFQSVFEFNGVDVALERHFQLCVLCLVHGAVECDGLASLDVSFGSIEVRVARHDVAFMHEVREQHVFGCASLVGRYHVIETCNPLDGIFKSEERVCSGVALVAHHDACPLAVAHRTCA